MDFHLNNVVVQGNSIDFDNKARITSKNELKEENNENIITFNHNNNTKSLIELKPIKNNKKLLNKNGINHNLTMKDYKR